MSALPAGPFSLVYADPPWTFITRSAKGRGRCPDGRGHYGVMTLGDIKALPVGDICARNSVLALWATNPMLPEALDVMAAWGFGYRTKLTWAKRSSTGKHWQFGTGYWLRSSTEDLLIGVRGHWSPRNRRTRSIFEAPVGRHSEKPDGVRGLIVDLVGDVPRIELFARSTAPGWTAWGDQVGKLDEAA